MFESLRTAFGDELFAEFYGDDWRAAQGSAVETVCRDPEVSAWVATVDGAIAGFTALKIDADERMGEVWMIAVDPDFQRRGIATHLTEHAMSWFRDAGMSVVMIETGGDPGHEPARRTYESCGLLRFPVARYFKKL